jgi:hypothetical protein
MNPEYLEKLKIWVEEQIEDFKRKGATEALSDEPAFIKLIYETALLKHIDELRANPDMVKQMLLGAIAKIDRDRGDLECAEQYERFADNREWEEIEKDWEETHGRRLEAPFDPEASS